MVKIILSGYMGSGKTAVAQILAAKTGLKHVDLDHEIEKREGLSIAGIFSEKGEVYFRKTEHSVLKDILAVGGPIILSLGGGTPCYAGNDALISGNGKLSVYLQATPAELAERLQGETHRRPLLAGKSGEALLSFIGQHLFERSSYYMKADAVVATGGKSPEQIADEILSLT